ncbi:MAG: T9SS type A sorting domain-containing protein, partial [Crocinitomicaceae bacterium]
NFSGDGGGGGGGGGGYLGGNGQSGLTSNGQASGGTSYANPGNTSTSIVNGNSGKSQPNGSAGGAAVTATNAGNFGYSNNKGAGAAGASNNGASNNGTAGIVIIRYAGTPLATGGTITQSGGYTIHTFTTSGTFAFAGSTSSANVPNVSSCGASAVTFTGTVSAGLTLDWYDAATGGNLLSQGTTTFTTPVISTTTTYYVAVRNTTTGCVSATRLAVTATINSASTVTPNQTICMGATPATISLTSASGTIQWQSSTNNSTFTNIAGQTGTTLTGATMGALNSTMYYRAVITNGACVGNSPVHTVNVTTPTISASPVSTDLVWNGKVSNDWTNANNWWSYNGTTYGTAAAIPTSSTNVFIQGTSSCVLNQPTISTAVGYSKNITIETGATLTMNTGSLTVSGNWTKNGSFVAGSGTVTMNGTSAQTIAGNGTTTFNNLTINNTSTGVVLSAAVDVQATLAMTNGNIVTSSTNLLTLGIGSVGTLNWSTGTVVGPFKRWFTSATNTGNASGLFPVGTSISNRWALLEYSTAPTTAGYLSAEFKAVNPTTTSAGTNGITLVDQYNWQLDNIATDGYWEIIPTTIDGGNYNLTLRPKDFATIGSTFDVCRLIKSPNNHVSWTLDGTHGSTAGSQADFTISRTGMAGFSYFAIAYPTAAPLPVELISFQANCMENQTVSITWSTASEHNSSYFKIEKSRDGMNWTVLSQVEGAGNSTTLLNYEIIDSEKTTGVAYYRLTQVDFDGASETFNIASVNCGGSDISESLKVYPNPSEGEFYLELDNTSTNNEVVLSMLDLEGKVIYSETRSIEKGNNTYQLNDLNVSPGIYFIEVKIGETISRIKHSIR